MHRLTIFTLPMFSDRTVFRIFISGLCFVLLSVATSRAQTAYPSPSPTPCGFVTAASDWTSQQFSGYRFEGKQWRASTDGQVITSISEASTNGDYEVAQLNLRNRSILAGVARSSNPTSLVTYSCVNPALTPELWARSFIAAEDMARIISDFLSDYTHRACQQGPCAFNWKIISQIKAARTAIYQYASVRQWAGENGSYARMFTLAGSNLKVYHLRRIVGTDGVNFIYATYGFSLANYTISRDLKNVSGYNLSTRGAYQKYLSELYTVLNLEKVDPWFIDYDFSDPNVVGYYKTSVKELLMKDLILALSRFNLSL